MKTELEERTLKFSLAVIRFVTGLSRNSVNDFIHKTALAEKEASETVYWLQICVHAKIGPAADAKSLLVKAGELLAILTTINRKAKGR